MEANCERLCECLGNGNIRCSPISCLPDEVCTVKDGVVGCFPSNPVTCRVYGDPHYITFDGKAYSFWGTCNYTIAKTCGPTVTQFTITARNEGRENSTTSSLNSIALDMEGFHLTIRKNKLVYVSVFFIMICLVVAMKFWVVSYLPKLKKTSPKTTIAWLISFI